MINKLPNLAYEILDEIKTHQDLTQDELEDKIGASSDEIKYAVRRLQENNIVQQIPDLLDMRTVSYRLPIGDELKQMEDKVSNELLNKLSTYFDFNLTMTKPKKQPRVTHK